VKHSFQKVFKKLKSGFSNVTKVMLFSCFEGFSCFGHFGPLFGGRFGGSLAGGSWSVSAWVRFSRSFGGRGRRGSSEVPKGSKKGGSFSGFWVCGSRVDFCDVTVFGSVFGFVVVNIL